MWRSCVFFGALAALAALGCERRPGESAPAAAPAPALNVLIVTLDTTRADHLGFYGYYRDTSPNLDALAAESIVFERAYAPMATTLPTHVSLFTGLHPLEHGILANIAHGGRPFVMKPAIVPLAEMAQEAGYATAAFISATPLKSPAGLNAGFETYGEPRGTMWSADVTTGHALEWLEENAQRPFLLWVHYFDPHFPYNPPAEFRDAYQADAAQEAWILERRMAAQTENPPPNPIGRLPTPELINRYDGEIRFMDREFGRLLERLRERGLWESTAILVASDHGEGLNQHNWLQHGGTWREQIRIALTMRVPGRPEARPRRVETMVSIMDALPTFSALVEAPWRERLAAQASGVDTFAAEFRERPILSLRTGRQDAPHAGPARVFRSPDWILHTYDTRDDALLFHFPSDPHELTDSAAANAEIVERMRAQMSAVAALYARRAVELEMGGTAPEPQPVDPQLLRELRSLGYLGGDDEDDDDEQP